MTTQTRIADLNPESAAALVNVASETFKANNSLTTSGVAVTGPAVDLVMNGGSNEQKISFINRVDTEHYNHSSDDYDEKGNVGKITGGKYSVLRQNLNWGWAYTDLAQMITRYDIRAGLTASIPLFWNEVFENIAVASMKGAIASTPGLVIDNSTKNFSLEMLIDAATDYDGELENLIVSRKGQARLKKMNINAYVPTGKTDLNVDRWAGYNVIVSKAVADDEMIIAGNGALVFGFANTPFMTPTALKRDEDAGNGGGGEILRVRKSGLVAPQGMDYKGPEKPTLVDLADAATWQRVGNDNEKITFRSVKFKL